MGKTREEGREKEWYVCSACGQGTSRWQGQCKACGEWNTLARELGVAGPAGGQEGRSSGAILLEEALDPESEAISTRMSGLDAVLGRGLEPGAAILLSGEPGIGKSTLLLQLAYALARGQGRAAYVSGEESLAQLRGRADRLGLLGPGLTALATNRLDEALQLMDQNPGLDLLILDSVQTMTSSQAPGLPGSVGQVRSVAVQAIDKAKETGTAVVLVGHVTKDGQIAGPKILEHMVDTVLYLEGDRQHLYRLLRVIKNRFGPSDELLVLEMAKEGLKIVDDPATFFLQARDPGLSGTALVMAAEGHRTFAVEVQALACKSYLAFPRRTAVGLEANRLNLILAVMEKRLKLNLSQMDIYVKIGGGLKLTDPGLDLGLAVAILSSIRDRALPEGAVFWGEVDLNGQVRPVFSHALRLRQAGRLGYTPVFHPKAGQQDQAGWTRIGDVSRCLFG
ncbi:MAG: DNA repair protein RadA [Deltaproteobacteria bacterium]|nr:DNA repair protein RadA [Deltaproteobacteria bacterium]